MASLLNMSGGSLLKKGLPYDAEIEYLESTGTQYIDTGFIPKNTTRVILTFKDYVSPGKWLFGARKGYLSDSFGIYTKANTLNNVEVQYRNIVYIVSNNYDLSKSDVTTIDFNAKALKVTISSKLGTVTTNLSPQIFTTSKSLYLFNLNNNGSGISPSSFKMMSCVIYDDNTIVCDLIPVRVGITGYLYDKVSGQLFGNQGTGNFILGPEV